MPSPTDGDPRGTPATSGHARRSRNEALAILATWAAFAAWVVGYAAAKGYDTPAPGQPVDTTLGFPSWVFFGVALPWLAATTVTVVFALAIMRDHPLEEVDER